jgi:nucleoside-diphosphate-sugar epimerase
MTDWTCLTATAGHTVTVFGATGFLGRYIVNRLGMERLLLFYNTQIVSL